MTTSRKKSQNGKPEQIQNVALKDLHVDEAYQRGIRMNRVLEYYNNWQDEACGTIIVNRRQDGMLYVVDGQHRMAAALRLGKTHLPARVVVGLTPKGEAELRIATNRSQPESPAERFKAELIAEVPEALAIVKIMKQFKAIFGLDKSTPGTVNAIASVEKMYRLDKGVTLREVFGILHEADGELNANNTQQRISWAVEWFLRNHRQEMDRKRLITIISQSKEAMKKRGDYLAVTMSGSKMINTYRALVELYNDGVAKAAQLELITKGYKSMDSERQNVN